MPQRLIERGIDSLSHGSRILTELQSQRPAMAMSSVAKGRSSVGILTELQAQTPALAMSNVAKGSSSVALYFKTFCC